MKTQSIPTPTRFRKHLNADALNSRIFITLKKIPEHRRGKYNILLVDALMSAFAMFVLKDPSMNQDKEIPMGVSTEHFPWLFP